MNVDNTDKITDSTELLAFRNVLNERQLKSAQHAVLNHMFLALMSLLRPPLAAIRAILFIKTW